LELGLGIERPVLVILHRHRGQARNFGREGSNGIGWLSVVFIVQKRRRDDHSNGHSGSCRRNRGYN
jgi:hypothetical protein